MLRRNGPVVKSVESVLRLEGSLWGERFVEFFRTFNGTSDRHRVKNFWVRSRIESLEPVACRPAKNGGRR